MKFKNFDPHYFILITSNDMESGRKDYNPFLRWSYGDVVERLSQILKFDSNIHCRSFSEVFEKTLGSDHRSNSYRFTAEQAFHKYVGLLFTNLMRANDKGAKFTIHSNNLDYLGFRLEGKELTVVGPADHVGEFAKDSSIISWPNIKTSKPPIGLETKEENTVPKKVIVKKPVLDLAEEEKKKPKKRDEIVIKYDGRRSWRGFSNNGTADSMYDALKEDGFKLEDVVVDLERGAVRVRTKGKVPDNNNEYYSLKNEMASSLTKRGWKML